jgi:hypothetical protein
MATNSSAEDDKDTTSFSSSTHLRTISLVGSSIAASAGKREQARDERELKLMA